jgi:Fe-S-cluster containining protein
MSATATSPPVNAWTAPVVKPRREQVPAGANLCEYCTAKCCHYFALQIDAPTEWRDFEIIRWYMIHGDVALFTEDGDWYLLVYSVCRHLQPDRRCGIYETRPQICRDYTTKECEYEDDWVYDQYLETPEQVVEYMDAVLPKVKGESIRSAKPELLPVIG